MKYPSNLELLNFFGQEPLIEEDIHFYKVVDAAGFELMLSFDVCADSFQTSISFDGRIVALVCYEGMTSFWVDDNTLKAKFQQEAFEVTVTVAIRPLINVEWSGLRTI